MGSDLGSGASAAVAESAVFCFVPRNPAVSDAMPHHTMPKNPAVLSHYAMRRLVGIIALFLPFMLVGGNILFALAGPDHALPHPLLERSISDYRYTVMGDCYVGSLCAIAAFLMCARGYDLFDEIAGMLAGVFALGVAVCPSEDPRLAVHSLLQREANSIHTVFAALMYLVLTYFCLVRFRMTEPATGRTRRKRHRDAVYAICGVTMLACDAVMVGANLKSMARVLEPLDPLLISESLALVAFGTAWLTKGRAFLRDRPRNHNHNHVNHSAQRVAV